MTTEMASKQRVVDAVATLRARLKHAGAAKVLEALDKSTVDDVSAVAALFVHTTLGRGIEDDVAEALARMGDAHAEGTLIIGLRSKRPALRRAAARALCIAPSTSSELRAALKAANAARDDHLRRTLAIALALSSKDPKAALNEELDRATSFEARNSIVRVLAASSNAELRRALLPRATDPGWADVHVVLGAALAGGISGKVRRP